MFGRRYFYLKKIFFSPLWKELFKGNNPEEKGYKHNEFQLISNSYKIEKKCKLPKYPTECKFF